MKKTHGVAMLAVLCGLSLAPVSAQTDNPSKPLDTSRDVRKTGPVADQQKNNKSDIQIAADIRKAVVADKDLSSYAHNVKIIARNGHVTLRGPVRSAEEKQSIAEKANQVAGTENVKDQMTIRPEKQASKSADSK